MSNYKQKLERMKAIEIDSHFTLAKIAEELAQNKERIVLSQNNVDDVTTPQNGELTVFIDEEGKLSGKTPAGDKISLGGAELSTSLTETVEGKAADATVIKTLNDSIETLNDSKYPKLRNGNSIFTPNIVDIIQNLVAIGFSLSGADLSNLDLSSASFYGADLSGATLNSAILNDVNFIHANLSTTLLQSANLANSSMMDANMENASLTRANLYNANLISAILVNANLTDAVLASANLSYANLSYADLSNAILAVANLSYANLSYADLSNANLTLADLNSAVGLNSDINVALAGVYKDPNGNGSPWILTWTDGNTYSCDPSTGLFTLVP